MTHVSRALVLSAGLLVGCGGASSTAPAASHTTTATTPALTAVAVSLSAVILQVGQSASAIAQGGSASGSRVEIGPPVWSTEIPSIATVSASGVVTALAPGRSYIYATVGGVQGQALLTVTPAAATKVTLAPVASTLAIGATVALTATVFDSAGRTLTDRIVTWVSQDTTKATVSASGVVTGRAPGAVTITVNCERAAASVVLTVPGASGAVLSVAVSPGAANISTGSTLQFAAIESDLDGSILSGRATTWTSAVVLGAGTVATLSASGLLTAVSPGTITVTATSEGQTGTATVTITQAVDTNLVVSFAAPALNALVGDTLVVVANVHSTYPLTSVFATILGQKVPLKLAPVGALGAVYLWTGNVDVSSLPTGPWNVTVTATDNRGSAGVASALFLRDTRSGKGGTGKSTPQK
jgi:uncharacterized protein YjdB